MILKSNEEKIFYSYLLELEKKGFINNIQYEPESFILSYGYSNVLREHKYTPDFSCSVIKECKLFDNDKFFFTTINNKAYFEVKPKFNKFNTIREFKINQKWVFSKYNILVNLVKIPDIFFKTFFPKDYILYNNKIKNIKNKEIRLITDFLK